MPNNTDIISKIVDYIEEHLTYDLDLNKIAHIAGYSKFRNFDSSATWWSQMTSQ